MNEYYYELLCYRLKSDAGLDAELNQKNIFEEDPDLITRLIPPPAGFDSTIDGGNDSILTHFATSLQ